MNQIVCYFCMVTHLCQAFACESDTDYRTILQQIVQESWRLGYDVRVTVTAQFYVGTLNKNRFVPVKVSDEFVAELQKQVADMPVAIARGSIDGILQCEVSTSAIEAADAIIKTIAIAKKVGTQCGVLVTTMPKPSEDLAHSSLWLSISLFDLLQQKNAFYDLDDLHHLSYFAKQFVAGVLDTVQDFSIVLRPSITSYKQVTPLCVSWSLQQTGTPTVCQIADGAVIIQGASVDAPIYLLLASIVKAGLFGICHQYDIGDPVQTLPQKNDELVEVQSGRHQLASTLAEAIERAAQSDFMRDWLGATLDEYLEKKRAEVQAYNNAVTDWELKRYL